MDLQKVGQVVDLMGQAQISQVSIWHISLGIYFPEGTSLTQTQWKKRFVSKNEIYPMRLMGQTHMKDRITKKFKIKAEVRKEGSDSLSDSMGQTQSLKGGDQAFGGRIGTRELRPKMPPFKFFLSMS